MQEDIICFGVRMKKPEIVRFRGSTGAGFESSQRALTELGRRVAKRDGYSYKIEMFKGHTTTRYGIIGTLINKTEDKSVTHPLLVNGRLVLFYFETPPTPEHAENTRRSAELAESAHEIERPAWSYRE